jgi:MOSC domain-containing protein YiiM
MSGARLEAIWIKRAHRGPMDAVSHARLVAGQGIEGNADYGSRRQVTLIQREVWDRLPAQLGQAVDPSARRANLLVSGVDLARTRNCTLSVGDLRIRILGETRPCERMNAACPGLRAALSPDWGAGAWGEVLDDGDVAVGDPVCWVDGE